MAGHCHNHEFWPSSLMAAAIQPGATMGPIGHVMSFMANWSPWVFYGLYAIAPLNHHLWPQAISCHHWPSWPISTSPTPRPGGSFYLPGGSGPPSHHHWPRPTPFHYGGFGLNGLFGPFRPPTASTVRTDRGPRSAVRRPIRPLLA
ncbi:hypothetical protein O181_104309 [Austropuccinia psidii MF-1]|uniref:Uncharacterized protein n=1 Tax=Austropuccinia psidii MF-1 TaxID=1389203 RepID=A0A9Q3JMW0_9BASI|nr:hypothetical protein [Austropuccinia psidii MF-1]